MSLINYHKSITQEIISTSNRVRDLVTHWGEEGRYKEEVFKSILRRFLPDNLNVGTGFVLMANSREIHESSKQIDVIIYDNSYPVLFKQGDFVITSAEGVRAIVEIKANVLNKNLDKIVRTCNENGKFIFDAKRNKDNPLFNGIFSFGGRSTGVSDANREVIRTNFNSLPILNRQKYALNHIAISQDQFIKYWGDLFDDDSYSQYKLEDLAFSFFISNILDFVSNDIATKDNFLWFATNKEARKELDF